MNHLPACNSINSTVLIKAIDFAWTYAADIENGKARRCIVCCICLPCLSWKYSYSLYTGGHFELAPSLYLRSTTVLLDTWPEDHV